jgi:hypothetical protein
MKSFATDILACLTLSLGCALSGFAQSSVEPFKDRSSILRERSSPARSSRFRTPSRTTLAAPRAIAKASSSSRRSPVPLELKISLALGKETQTVNVEAGADLIETTSTTHTDVDRDLFDKLPLEAILTERHGFIFVDVYLKGACACHAQQTPIGGRRVDSIAQHGNRCRRNGRRHRSSRLYCTE